MDRTDRFYKIQSLQERPEQIVVQGKYAPGDIRNRIKVSTIGRRRTSPRHFQTIADALLSRQRLHITHFGRSNTEETARDVPPGGSRVTAITGTWIPIATYETVCALSR